MPLIFAFLVLWGQSLVVTFLKFVKKSSPLTIYDLFARAEMYLTVLLYLEECVWRYTLFLATPTLANSNLS